MQIYHRSLPDNHCAVLFVQARTIRDRIRTITTQCRSKGARQRRQRRHLKAGAARSAPGTPPGGPVPARTSLHEPQQRFALDSRINKRPSNIMMKITKAQREIVRMKFGGKCAYCGCELPAKGWHLDHVAAIYRVSKLVRESGTFKILQTGHCEKPEGENPENYFPACASCNLFKSVFSIEVWRGELAKQVERARKKSFNFRFAERFGLIQETGNPVVFWFEKYQQTQVITSDR
jgi:hypothetical protein